MLSPVRSHPIIHCYDSQHSWDTALQLLRKLGWVHRDVSVRNILWFNNTSKLMDLEYAKRVGDTTSHETRTVSRT
jgi:serine/threonine-protein kinase RIO1